MGRGRTLVATMSCGVFIVALCSGAEAGVVTDSSSAGTVARVQSRTDHLPPSVSEPTSGPAPSVTDTADGVVDKTTDTVAEATNAVTRPDPERIVKKVVTTVRNVVDKVLPPPQTVSDPLIDEQRETTRHRDGRPSPDAGRHPAVDRHGAHSTRFRVSDPLALVGVAGAAPLSDRATHDSSSGGLLHRLGRAAKEIAFPALLALLVIAFLIAQDRIDKSDPKLITWTPEKDGELVVFE